MRLRKVSRTCFGRWGEGAGLLELHVHFRWKVQMRKNGKVICEEASWDLLKSCLSFGEGLEDSNEEKMKRQ